MTPPQPPAFTGLFVHREPRHGYSLLVPDGWRRRELESQHGDGAVFAPDPDDVANSFSIEARDLGTAVTADDLATLRDGFRVGLRKLPGSTVERLEAEAVGELVTMEARHTFRDGPTRRKRWVRLLYQGTLQVRLIAQGATPEQFDYWEPMFFQMMRSFRFGDWWSEALGVEWAETNRPEDER